MAASTPEHSLLLNDDIDTYDFKEIKKELDYMYYINRSMEQMSGSWVELDWSGVYRTNQFDYFENQNVVD